MKFIQRHLHQALSLFIALIFLQSLWFKFMRSPETIYIFEEKLDPWAASLGFPGLFAPGGVFSAYVVGSMELVASLLLIAALLTGRKLLQLFGAALSLGVISGAIFFHLCTPLGVAVRNADGSSDSGQLFMLACGVWLCSAALIYLRRAELGALLTRFRA